MTEVDEDLLHEIIDQYCDVAKNVGFNLLLLRLHASSDGDATPKRVYERRDDDHERIRSRTEFG